MGLRSKGYTIGENHGLSALAGVLDARPDLVRSVRVLDPALHPEAPEGHVADTILAAAVDVVWIALPHGTYSVLRDAYPAISRALDAGGTRVVLGGALADQLADHLLALEPAAVVVRGEAEVPFVDLLQRWTQGVEDLHGIPGTAFVAADGVVVTTEPTPTDLEALPPPARGHVVGIAEAGGPIYAESSRSGPGRGRAESAGRRRFPAKRLADDFQCLRELGVSRVVFTDEDLLGPDLTAAEAYVGQLLTCLPPGKMPSFEFSTTTHSLYRHNDDALAHAARAKLLVQLREIGLEKVLLDIGSASDGQLRRYGRSYLAEESAAAVYRARAAGLQLEVGLVMFDPLVTVDEVAENVAFIRRTGIAGEVSVVGDEMVLQSGSPYLEVLEHQERDAGRTLYGRSVDLDTLSHAYDYASDDIARLVAGIRPEAQAQQAISAPVTIAIRRTSNATASAELAAVLARWKDATLGAVEAGLHAVGAGQDPQPAAEEAMIEAGWSLASDLIGTQRRLPASLREDSELVTAVQRSRRFIEDPRPPRAVATGSTRTEVVDDG